MVSSIEIVALIGSIAIILAIGYGVYWAFSIRRALAVPLYRRQALSFGLIGTLGILDFVFLGLLFTYDLSAVVAGVATPIWDAWVITNIGFELMLFYWVDASILTARRTDSLLRNTFGWRRLRLAAWALVIGLNLVQIVLPNSVFRNPTSLQGLLVTESPLVVIAATGVSVLPIAARRSGDKTLRRHLIWLGLFVATVFLSGVPSVVTAAVYGLNPTSVVSPLTVAEVYLISLLAAYFGYRSSRSLAPLNRISLD
jgi:hypothetical protein